MTEQRWQSVVLFWFHLLVLTVPFIFTWQNEELFEFPKMLTVYAISLAVGGSWLARMITAKRKIWKKTWLDYPLLAFLVSQVASTVFSIHPATSFWGYYTRFHGGLASALCYYLLFYALVSNVSEVKQAKRLLLTTLIASFGVVLYAIPEHFGYSPSCAIIEHQWGVGCWIQDVKSRIFGTFGQPNWLAAYALMMVPVALASLWQVRDWAKLIALDVLTVLLTLTVIYTQSRSGWLGLGVSLAALVIGGGVMWLSRPTSANSKTLQTSFLLTVASCVTVGLMLVSLGGPIHDQLQGYLSKFTQEESIPTPTPQQEIATAPAVNRLDVGGTDSGEIRSIVWTGAINIWKRYPVLGSGVETFAYSYYLDRPIAHNLVSEWDFLYNKAHNEFLNYLATTGIIGLATYSVLLLWFSWHTLRWTFTSKASFPDRVLGLALVCSVLGLSVSNFFGFSTVMVTVLMYLWFAMAVILSTAKNEVPRESKNSKRIPVTSWQIEQTAAMFLVGGVVLIGWWQIYQTLKADQWYTLGKQYVSQGYLDTGAGYLQLAAKASPQEGLFVDELSTTYAQLAISLFSQGENETANQFAQAALVMSDQALKLNPAQLNFHRSRVRMLLTLAQANPALAEEAEKAILVAQQLAPTDAKLVYFQATIAHDLGNSKKAVQLLRKSIEMKPNYEQPRMLLAEIEWRELQQSKPALEQVEYILQYIAPNNQVAKDLKAEIATMSAKK